MFKVKKTDDEIDISVDIDTVDVVSSVAFVAGLVMVWRAFRGTR